MNTYYTTSTTTSLQGSSLLETTHMIRQWQSLRGGVGGLMVAEEAAGSLKASSGCSACGDDVIIDWKGFESYLLQTCNKKTTGDRLRYARKYASVLSSARLDDVLQLSGEKRLHVMKTLSSLAKYTGQYDNWLKLRQRYNLKWVNENANLQSFERFFSEGLNFDIMVKGIKEMISKTPVPMAQIIKFATFTGLRPGEAVQSVRLLINVEKKSDDSSPSPHPSYYNEQRQCLEHFRYPTIFLRRTKTAYISIVDKEMISEITKNIGTNNDNNNNNSKIPTYSAIHMHLNRQHLPMHMAYCRKVYASHLRQSGIESEMIDLLQGRVPRSVFARHYFRPSASYKDRVLEAVSKLKKEIES